MKQKNIDSVEKSYLKQIKTEVKAQQNSHHGKAVELAAKRLRDTISLFVEHLGYTPQEGWLANMEILFKEGNLSKQEKDLIDEIRKTEQGIRLGRRNIDSFEQKEAESYITDSLILIKMLVEKI